MIKWSEIPYFTEKEAWGDPNKIKPVLLYGLVALRKFVNKPIQIHCGTQGEHVAGSFHESGMAVDLHIEGMHVVDQFLAASRFAIFSGIGVYPLWNSPGLHLDIRPVNMRAQWWRDAGGSYQQIDVQSIKSWK